MTPFSLADKHIVVSGASSGIGQQCAISCAAMGAKVSLLGRNIERLKETLSAMKGDGHNIFVVELTVEEDVKVIVEDIVATSGQIDGLLNVAGISSTLLLRSVSEKKMDELFKSNVY